MNLVWLKYVSYACLAGMGFFYADMRGKLTRLSWRAKLAGFAIFTFLAAATWHVQESNAEQNSPRRVIVGTVTSVSAHRQKSGSIDDEFQLRLNGGALSPKFSTDTVAHNSAEQPIHEGDTLGVLYRTWDDVPETIDEFAGSRTGWHYRRYRVFDPYVWVVGGVGFSFVMAVLIGRLIRRRPDSGPGLSPQSD